MDDLNFEEVTLLEFMAALHYFQNRATWATTISEQDKWLVHIALLIREKVNASPSPVQLHVSFIADPNDPSKNRIPEDF